MIPQQARPGAGPNRDTARGLAAVLGRGRPGPANTTGADGFPPALMFVDLVTRQVGGDMSANLTEWNDD
jgi:hypothetical protein